RQLNEVSKRVVVLQVELAGTRLVFPLEPAGEAECSSLAFVNEAVHDRDRGLEAVAIFDQPDGRVLILLGYLAIVPLGISRRYTKCFLYESLRKLDEVA